MIRTDKFQRDLGLTCLVETTREELNIESPDLNRPGMQFCGFYEHFAWERPQIIGIVEMAYLEQQEPKERITVLKKYFDYSLPCVIICRGLTPPPEMLALAGAANVPVFLTNMATSRFTALTIHYLSRELAPHELRHGVLMDVYGVGVFLSGKSGVGKSEAALELVKRGHMLVADDVVDICKVSENRLIGTCPDAIRHLMEIRGIGLIDVQAMFGVSAVTNSKTIDLVLELEAWDENKFYDRVGLNDETTEILGVPIIRQMMPVRPGRNLAIIIEVAARNLSLKRMGYHAARNLNQRIFQSAPAEMNLQTHHHEEGFIP
ncbi:MAG: HPr(Ser) kinase/phosphatase [Clostridia bacterium]|nr:HPr(Ser) kinase/phosphatase [Clostridia bacterium]